MRSAYVQAKLDAYRALPAKKPKPVHFSVVYRFRCHVCRRWVESDFSWAKYCGSKCRQVMNVYRSMRK